MNKNVTSLSENRSTNYQRVEIKTTIGAILHKTMHNSSQIKRSQLRAIDSYIPFVHLYLVFFSYLCEITKQTFNLISLNNLSKENKNKRGVQTSDHKYESLP